MMSPHTIPYSLYVRQTREPRFEHSPTNYAEIPMEIRPTSVTLTHMMV